MNKDTHKHKLSSAIGVRSADDTTIELIPCGAQLPASGRALLTTVSAANYLVVDIIVGNRLRASSNDGRTTIGGGWRGGRIDFAMEEGDVGVGLPRGVPQVLVTAEVGDEGMRITVRDMISDDGSRQTVVLFDRDDGNEPLPMDGGLTDYRSLRKLLPRPWRFDNPYTPLPHPGYTFDAKFIKLHQRPHRAHQTAVPKRDGDVLPSFTASRVWPAAYVTAEFLETLRRTEPDVPFGRVLELGAGTGLVGMAAALVDRSGETTVTLTDLPENLPLLHSNVRLNSLHNVATVEALDWTQPLPPSLTGPWDVVVAADCVYWEYLFEPLIDTLVRLASSGLPTTMVETTPSPEWRATAPPTTRVYVSMTHRKGRTRAFLALLRERCGRVERMETNTGGVFYTDVYQIFCV